MTHTKSIKSAKIQKTYVPPVFNCVKNLKEQINNYDSVIIVSNDLRKLPEFPHTNAFNELLENESIEFFEVIESSGIKFIVSPPQKSNHKQYIEAISLSLNVARDSGLINPLVLIHNYPQTSYALENLSKSIEKVLQSVFVSLRPNQKDHNDTIRRNKKHSVKALNMAPSPPLSPKSNDEIPIIDDENAILFFNLQGAPSRTLWFIKEFEPSLYSKLKIINLKSLKELKSYFHEVEDVVSFLNVPILKFGKDFTLWDSGSIISYLIDKRRRESNEDDVQMIPPDWNKEQWHLHNFYSYWTVATLDPKISEGSSIFQELFFGSKNQWWKNCEKKIVEDLGDKDYIQSNEFTITDIFIGYSIHLAYSHGMLKNANPKILEYYQRIASRDAFKKFVLLTSSDDKENVTKEATNNNENSNNNEERAEDNENEKKVEKSDDNEEQRDDGGGNEEKKEHEIEENNKKEEKVNLNSVGFHFFDLKGIDFTGLAKALSAIEKTGIQIGNSKVTNYDFVKSAIENDIGSPLVEELKE